MVYLYSTKYPPWAGHEELRFFSPSLLHQNLKIIDQKAWIKDSKSVKISVCKKSVTNHSKTLIKCTERSMTCKGYNKWKNALGSAPKK